jgi:hypothetical protein
VKTPDILNSKIKKIRIELPHYSFSHSSSGDSPHAFIGRERTREKLVKVLEDSPDEPGVYLIAGNRGVGKTSLVSWIINETSLKTKTSFTENFKYVFLLLLAVAGTQFCLQNLCVPVKHPDILEVISFLVFVLLFIILCCYNSYRYKTSKQKYGIFNKIWNGVKSIPNCIASAIKELSYLINLYNPYRKTQYLLKIILIVSFTQFVSIITNRFITPTVVLFVYLVIVIPYNLIFRFKRNNNEKTSKNGILSLLRNYIKNHSRLYLRINFGHKLKDEKDILRLITRTLSTEYSMFRRSFWRMLPWRVIAFGLLFLFALLFSPIVERQEFYQPIKESTLYNVSSQILFKCPNLEDKKRLEGVFYIMENKVDSYEKLLNKCIWSKTKINTKVGNFGKFLLVLDQFVYEITKVIKKSPRFFLCKYDKIHSDNKFISPINYLFWLSFFSMYLFCILLFRCTWITHFFVTHRIINRRLKKLNIDITHGTERENSINIKGLNNFPEIGTKTIKSRNVADAREIEKELQDILDDIKQIPLIMCRPNIVIVFDELDKVEPDYVDSEKEIKQTKASLFSIGATRERQTEILRILSNMKYFLSSAKAKFIFIAGREMFDIHLADVSERNNYIGSIFNVVILVPSFLTDHHTGEKYIPQESSIASLTEEFVCRKLIPHDYPVETYNLKNYRIYLEKKILRKNTKNNKLKKDTRHEEIQKIIAILQQFIIYLAHVSKGAPKKMIQLFESFVEIRTERDKPENTLLVQRYNSSRHFLSFNYYKQYTIGIIAYLITPIFYRLAESNIKEHSDKLLVPSLRFVDFLFKFHKHSFSWKHLDMSPEMLEVNRAPELKSVAVDLLNYLAQVHIDKSNFSLSDYKFDGLIANEIFAMAKTDEVFSALFSFSLDEMLPLKKHYQDLLEKTEKEYKKGKRTSEYIDAISSLQVVLGDLNYYDDQLEEAEAYYKSAVQVLSENVGKMTLEKLYVYVRNMLRLGIIYEKRKQYDFAYMTYGDLCKRIIQGRTIAMSKWQYNSHNCYDMLLEKMTYEGLKILYLPFIAKFQILEKSHVGSITYEHLKLLKDEFELVTHNIDFKEANLIEAEFYSRVADILYYKNSDLKYKKDKIRKDDNDEEKCNCENKESTSNSSDDVKNLPKNISCTACYYYHKALSILLGKPDFDEQKNNNKYKNTVMELLSESVKQLKDNYNVKYCTILARILSDWSNVFFSCDTKNKENGCECYICDRKICNTITEKNTNDFLVNCIKFIESEKENKKSFSLDVKQLKTKKDVAFAMYSISSVAYRNANLYKRSSYQIFKMLCLFKHYKIWETEKLEKCITQLSEQAIHYLLHANEDLKLLELNKRKKDFDKESINKLIPLQNILVDNEITRIRILVKELELKMNKEPENLKEYYNMRITSPYKINYSIVGRVYQLRLKSIVNYEVYQNLLKKFGTTESKRTLQSEIEFILENPSCNETAKEIFGDYFNFDNEEKAKIQIFENLIAESIYCLIDIAQLSETVEETFVFSHCFLGTIHNHLSFWIRLYETYEIYKKEKPEIKKYSRIEKYLKQYLDEEWREQLSGYRENQRALSRYYKCLEMHNEGRAYHNMIDTMCYLKDDFNDRSDHFNIAEERHLIVNGIIEKKINDIKIIYKESKLYKVENYFEKV